MKLSLWAHREWLCLKELGQAVLLDWCDLVGGGVSLRVGFEFSEAQVIPSGLLSLFLWPASIEATSSVQCLPV